MRIDVHHIASLLHVTLMSAVHVHPATAPVGTSSSFALDARPPKSTLVLLCAKKSPLLFRLSAQQSLGIGLPIPPTLFLSLCRPMFAVASFLSSPLFSPDPEPPSTSPLPTCSFVSEAG